MKKLFKTVLFLLIPACLLFLVAGCNFNLNMTPVEGPMMKDNPAAITVKGTIDNKDQTEFTMPNGEVFKGPVKTKQRGSENFDSISLFGYSTWQKYWGDKFEKIANLPKTKISTATLTGDKGTILTAEFIYWFKPPYSGLIKDGNGNLYKAQVNRE